MPSASLDRYRKKRTFPGSPEPDGAGVEAQGDLRFVVQKHAARRLHYDFRFEVDGVLKSWACPKGPSYDPHEKRLAVHVEDHPLDYATFEGVIPEKRYGAGNVIVWDCGTYSPDDEGVLSFGRPIEGNERMRRQLDAGKLSITLRGSKLRGSWTLVHTKGREDEANQWLLIKHRDEHAGRDLTEAEDDSSALSARTLEQVSRGVPEAAPARVATDPFPKLIRPMMAQLADAPFTRSGWVFEPKLDGVRTLAYLEQGKVTLRSRSDAIVTGQYPEVAEAVAGLGAGSAVLDGEIVALNPAGAPDFELLQQRMHLRAGKAQTARAANPVVYYVFDLPYAEGQDLTGLPLRVRKQRLNRLLTETPTLRLVHAQATEGAAFFAAVRAMGLEGMVAKQTESRYEPGQRSGAWLKVKTTQEQEFVVCGYLPGEGYRAASFGALVLGYYEDAALTYAGAVGSGFRNADLDWWLKRLKPLETANPPFEREIPKEVVNPTWVRPQMVVRVKFSNWTRDGNLRAPVYLGVREDARPDSVVRERAVPVPGLPAAPRATQDSGQVADVLRQLEGERDRLTLEIEGHRLALTNLDKAFWPALGKRAPITKRDFLRYLALVSPFMLPQLRDRPMNLTRYPNGFDGPAFYQKHWTTERPPFVEAVRLFSGHNEADQEYAMVQNLPTLLWMGQLATLELHPWLSRVTGAPEAAGLPTVFTGSDAAIEASVLNYPDFLIFDLDPYIYSGKEAPKQEPELNRTAFEQVRSVAFKLRDILDTVSLRAFVKTSGKTGLHLYVPVVRHYDYGYIRKACSTIGRFLAAAMPGVITMDWTVERRTGRIFFDHNQNSRGKTLVGPYSLRPSPQVTVSTPITWDELATVYPTDFTIATVPARLAKLGDPWRDILAAKQDLRPLFEGA